MDTTDGEFEGKMTARGRHCWGVWPDLVTSCLQRLSADDTSRQTDDTSRQRVNSIR